ncbi:hypothetical protein BKA82DRAFT_4187451 [Pisolithus tinctorius]|nr:hypothetical protein BKA82DRAFT_4187451 [Pisolithus tinctorius]
MVNFAELKAKAEKAKDAGVARVRGTPRSSTSSPPPPPPPRPTGSQGRRIGRISVLDDKEEFFRWLDEFFSRYLNVELGPRTSPGATSVRPSAARSGPPPVNTATRPHAF